MSRAELVRFDAARPRAQAIWRELEAERAPSYFLSWGFLESWLAALPQEHRPEVAVWFDHDRPLAACLLGSARVRRHGLVQSRVRFLNQSGVARFDEITLEHNQLLCAQPEKLTLARFLDSLPDDWDELCLPALSSEGFPGRALGEPLADHVLRLEREVSSPFVDLSRVRAAPGGYLSLLGKNTRAEIRRAQRGYGAIEVELARDEARALDVYEELVRLHQSSWRSRGVAGAFADPWFAELHRRLIRARFAHGEMQLLRLRACGDTIGCLYNFVFRGRVLFYQSGLAREADPRKKPGYVCHAEAVELNARAGRDVYDLLGGEARYKQSLATDATRLTWARIQRPLARFWAEDGLRRCKRAFSAVRFPRADLAGR